MLIFIYIYAVHRCAIGRGVTADWLGEQLDSDNRLRWRYLNIEETDLYSTTR